MQSSRVRVTLCSGNDKTIFLVNGGFEDISKQRFFSVTGEPFESMCFEEVRTDTHSSYMGRKLTVALMPQALRPDNILVANDGKEYTLTPVTPKEATTPAAT